MSLVAARLSVGGERDARKRRLSSMGGSELRASIDVTRGRGESSDLSTPLPVFEYGTDGPSYTVDDAINELGMGYFQYKMLFFTGFIWSADAMELMLLAFLIPELKDHWNIKSPFDAMISAVVFIGMLFGTQIWCVLADKYGRKYVVMASCFGCALFGTLCAVAPDIWFMLVMRFFVGFCVGGSAVSYTLFAEIAPTDHRGNLLLAENFFWSAGALWSVLMAWISLSYLNWRWYLVFCAVPLWFITAFSWKTPESPRWLASQGQMTKALDVLRLIAKENGETLPEGDLIEPVLDDITVNNNNNSNGDGSNGIISEKPDDFWDIFNRDAFGNNSIYLYTIFLVYVFVYYGISFISEEFFTENSSGGLYWKMAVTTSAEAPCLLIGIYGLDKWGRKNTMTASMIIYSASALVVTIGPVKDNVYLGVLFLFTARLTSFLAFVCIFIYFAEFYPTSLRASALGCASSLGRIAGSITSFVAIDLPIRYAMIIYAVSGIIAAICSHMLEFDTTGILMTDTVSEFKSLRETIAKSKGKKTIDAGEVSLVGGDNNTADQSYSQLAEESSTKV